MLVANEKNGCPNQASKQLTPNERKTKPQKLVANEKGLPYNQASKHLNQMKERPNHKSWWQTKKGCRNQASKQLTPNERNKTAETTSKTQTVAYLQT